MERDEQPSSGPLASSDSSTPTTVRISPELLTSDLRSWFGAFFIFPLLAKPTTHLSLFTSQFTEPPMSDTAFHLFILFLFVTTF